MIVFDGACLGDGPITGVGRAFLNGLAAYQQLGVRDFAVLVPGDDFTMLPKGVPGVAAPRGVLARQWQLPRLVRRLGARVLHSSVAAVPLRAPCATIATVHDLPWLQPESGERTSWWRRFATTRSLRAATAVIAPSAYTLEAAARLVGDRSKLRRIAHGTPVPELRGGAPRTGPFLVLGDDRPRKNRERVRAAHALAAQRCPGLPALRFVGPPADYVSEDEKARLLRECCAVVQVSTYEGFGMPVLEALAHGAPVVCSDIPPFREIAGAAAVTVDPHDAGSIAAGLIAVLQPAIRAALAREAQPRLASLSAAHTAASWRALHEELAP
jgi:hypothetical protein